MNTYLLHLHKQVIKHKRTTAEKLAYIDNVIAPYENKDRCIAHVQRYISYQQFLLQEKHLPS